MPTVPQHTPQRTPEKARPILRTGASVEKASLMDSSFIPSLPRDTTRYPLTIPTATEKVFDPGPLIKQTGSLIAHRMEVREKERDAVAVNEALNAARGESRDYWMQQTQRKGGAASGILKDAEESFSKARESYSGKLANENQRALFAERFSTIENHHLDNFARYQSAQEDEHRKDVVSGLIGSAQMDITANPSFENTARVMDDLRRGIDEMYPEQSERDKDNPEALTVNEQIMLKVEASLHEQALKSMAMRNPLFAMDYVKKLKANKPGLIPDAVFGPIIKTANERATMDDAFDLVDQNFGTEFGKAIEYINSNPKELAALSFEQRSKLVSYFEARWSKHQSMVKAQVEATALKEQEAIYGAWDSGNAVQAMLLLDNAKSIDPTSRHRMREALKKQKWEKDPAVANDIFRKHVLDGNMQASEVWSYVGHGLDLPTAKWIINAKDKDQDLFKGQSRYISLAKDHFKRDWIDSDDMLMAWPDVHEEILRMVGNGDLKGMGIVDHVKEMKEKTEHERKSDTWNQLLGPKESTVGEDRFVDKVDQPQGAPQQSAPQQSTPERERAVKWLQGASRAVTEDNINRYLTLYNDKKRAEEGQQSLLDRASEGGYD